jgi:hypothetical protein
VSTPRSAVPKAAQPARRCAASSWADSHVRRYPTVAEGSSAWPNRPSSCINCRSGSSYIGHRLPTFAPLLLPVSGDPAVIRLHISDYADSVESWFSQRSCPGQTGTGACTTVCLPCFKLAALTNLREAPLERSGQAAGQS